MPKKQKWAVFKHIIKEHNGLTWWPWPLTWLRFSLCRSFLKWKKKQSSPESRIWRSRRIPGSRSVFVFENITTTPSTFYFVLMTTVLSCNDKESKNPPKLPGSRSGATPSISPRLCLTCSAQVWRHSLVNKLNTQGFWHFTKISSTIGHKSLTHQNHQDNAASFKPSCVCTLLAYCTNMLTGLYLLLHCITCK